MPTENKTPKQPKEKPEVKPTARDWSLIYPNLTAPIPSDFLVSYTEDGKTFTGYHAQYAINLLNEVVGLGNWDTEETILKQELVGKAWFVAMKVDILIGPNTFGGHDIGASGYGAAYSRRGANAYKGAKTSAFKNACRYLGIGKELYAQGFDDDIVPAEVAAEIAVPDSMVQTPVGEYSSGAEGLIKQIETAESKEALEQLRNTVSEFVAGDAVKKLLLKKFNEKLLSFNN